MSSKESVAAWRARNPEHAKQYMRDWNRRLRTEVLDHYGGRCACCGETRFEFLALDHTDGGGNTHRAAVGKRGANMARWAKSNGFPAIFRVLCHNCNQAIGYYGACPHESE